MRFSQSLRAFPIVIAGVSVVGVPSVVHGKEGSWFDRAMSVFGSGDKDASDRAGFSSTRELMDALREALAVSAERALAELGEKGGFSESEKYRVPLPETVEQLRGPLRAAGQETLLNDFQATLNRAAEKAVAASPEIVGETIKGTTLNDLKELWRGEDDAITRFLEKRSRDALAERMRPEIEKATDASGAARTYKAVRKAVSENAGGLLSGLSDATGIGQGTNFDLNDYVSKQALDALFQAMAAEEKRIRENPAARSTDLLKQLFESDSDADGSGR